jgi:hypothetical protein
MAGFRILDDNEQPQTGFRILDDEPKKADPKIGRPEELTFAEKYLAPLLDKMGSAAQSAPGMVGDVSRTVLNDGNARGGAVGRLAMGAADPGVAIAQMGANAIWQGDAVNKGIQATEQQYQDARKQAGSEGFDPLRLTGNVAMTAFGAAALPTVSAFEKAPAVIRGLVQGGTQGLLQPITNGGENFWADKGKEGAVGAGVGAVASPLMGALARIVSPEASTNPSLALLKGEGVHTTVGQTLGGKANAIEERLMSVPILGDAIRSARQRSVDDLNNAAINRATVPIGVRVEGAGQEAVAKAGDALSNAYETALSKVHHVNFDTPAFNADLGQLTNMSQGLTGELARKFDKTLENVVLRKMSPNGSMLGSDIKAVDSELGQLAAKYGRSSVASESEFGDAVKQLQAIVRQEVGRANPAYAAEQKAADTGWANLVRVENASGRAVNNGGVFTPGQLNQSVRAMDKSTRHRATARGEALMQDLSDAGQEVLANRIPDSGTAGRVMQAVGLSALPVQAAASALYSKPVQNALRMLLSSRPGQAPAVANYLRRLIGPATLAGVPIAEQEMLH